ncbi:MAG: hypothetical protein J5I81_05405 [Nitrococcus mobilis]|nr:hypothetical protein [Nitrococcus mobilis]
MPDVVVLVTLFVVGTLIAYKVIHSPYRPSVGLYIVLFFVFALPLFFVFTFIPLMIVRRKTKNKPVAPPARYELQRHSSIRDDDDELNCLRNEPDYVNDPAFRSFADNIFSDRDH